MSKYCFSIKEVRRDGFIAWDAIEDSSGTSFPVNVGQYFAGEFLEITEYLKQKGISFSVKYDDRFGDSLRDGAWTYIRGDDQVIVSDIPRTIFRLTRT